MAILAPNNRPLRFAALARVHKPTRGLLLAQLGTGQTELIQIDDIAGATKPRLLTRTTYGLREGHDAFEQARLDWLCAGWILDHDARPTWQQQLSTVLGNYADELKIDVQQLGAPVAERTIEHSQFRTLLLERDTAVGMRRSGSWGLLASSNFGLHLPLLPSSMPPGVRWQEALGDIGGVDHPAPFVVLFRIDSDGVCALVDLLGYDGVDLRKASPFERSALLRQLVAELTGRGARWDAWIGSAGETIGIDVAARPAVWDQLALSVAGTTERLVLLDPQ